MSFISACKSVALFLSFLILAAPLTAQTKTSPSSSVIKLLGKGKPVHLKGVTLTGDLDFTRFKRKTRGGSYGGRVGRVQEWFSRIKQPLVLEDCVIQGRVITFREERKRLLLKEQFVTFEAPVLFRRCQFQSPVVFERLAFKDQLTIEQCAFAKELRFENIHFDRPPLLQKNQLAKGLIDRKTNLASKPEEKNLRKPRKPKQPAGIPIVLKNPSTRSVAIAFGKHRWNLSPRGTSTLEAAEGTRIYLLRNGKRDRELLTVTATKAGQVYDVTRL